MENQRLPRNHRNMDSICWRETDHEPTIVQLDHVAPLKLRAFKGQLSKGTGTQGSSPINLPQLHRGTTVTLCEFHSLPLAMAISQVIYRLEMVIFHGDVSLLEGKPGNLNSPSKLNSPRYHIRCKAEIRRRLLTCGMDGYVFPLLVFFGELDETYIYNIYIYCIYINSYVIYLSYWEPSNVHQQPTIASDISCHLLFLNLQ